MPTFKYTAITERGDNVEDIVEASSQTEAMSEINGRGMRIIEIKQSSQLLSMFTSKKVSEKDLAGFSKQLSYLMGTGIALHKGIEIIGEQLRNKHFKSVVQKVVRDIKEGIPLSQSLSVHPNVFPDNMVYQLKAAESGGFMQDALMNISKSFERDADFKSKIKGALIYPSMVLLLSFGIVYFLLTMVVPSLTSTLESFDTELPGITLFVMALSDFVQNYWYIGLMIVFGLAYGIYFILQDEERKRNFDKMLLRLPIVGNLIASVNIARMTRTMASLLGSGVPVDDTLDNISSVLGNKHMSYILKTVKDDVVNQGVTISKSMEMKPIFPKPVIQIFRVGEEAGNLPDVLLNLAENLEDEVANSLKTVTGMINPILTVFIGGIVGFVVAAMFMPMMSLMDNF